eukprot:TRINITY_DN15753_c0_g1_i1.p1 TRINITY_DN15753_c0_g1~~TRINITY_DN15753_c0_g1_i1.p1  ORF type:complete len:480 (+),score=56.93 TRINITY_DN15753_c0_g1_i1:45-1484(+)
MTRLFQQVAICSGLALLVVTILVYGSRHWVPAVERSCKRTIAIACATPMCTEIANNRPTSTNMAAGERTIYENAHNLSLVQISTLDDILPPASIGTKVRSTWLHDLNEVLSKAVYRDTIIFTTVKLKADDESKPKPYWENVENWRRSLALQLPNIRPLVGCENQLTCDMLRRLMQGPCEYYVFTGKVFAERTAFITGNAVGADWKWFFAQHIVRMGYHAFYSDVDVVFLHDPFPLVETPPLADFYALSDTLDDIGFLVYAQRNRSERQLVMEKQNLPDCSNFLWKEYAMDPNYCVGASVWFARATLPAYRYIKDVLTVMMQERHWLWEQKAMNGMVHRNRGRGMIFELFDARQAANFMLWSTATASLLDSHFPKEERVIFHAGYCSGGDNKRNAFKEWGVWTFSDAEPAIHQCHTPPCWERRRHCDSTMVAGSYDCQKEQEQCRWHLTPLPRPELSFADTFLARYRNSTRAALPDKEHI